MGTKRRYQLGFTRDDVIKATFDDGRKVTVRRCHEFHRVLPDHCEEGLEHYERCSLPQSHTGGHVAIHYDALTSHWSTP